MRNAPKPLPSIDYLRECFNYDPMTGVLTWKERPQHHFPTTRGFNIFTSKMVGKEAGVIGLNGYRSVSIENKLYLAHRVCFALANGHIDCALQIDHINHIRSDNRASNLRMVSEIENGQNQGRRTNNKSGVTGVSWCKRRNKWNVRLLVNNSYKFFGEYDTKEKAVEARIAALQKHGFHANHGL